MSPGPLILLAHGAGAPSSSAWMRRWKRHLATLGTVATFDDPDMRQGQRRPDRHDVLVAAHREALARARRRHAGEVVLAGKSMGGRIGCHLALEQDIAALVCLGYPLTSPAGRMRDEVLRALRSPVLFVQGTRDRLCSLDALAEVRAQMTAPSALHVVDSGDHSLSATKAWLQEHGETQRQVEARALAAIAAFLHAPRSAR
jgi:hypothetical protein